MANDVVGFAHNATGATLYAIIRNDDGEVWETAGPSFETYSTANIANYDTALTEQGTASQFYTFTFPSAITAGGYSITVYSGATAEGDIAVAEGYIEWTGSKIVAQTGDGAWTVQMADSVPSDGTISTREQALYALLQIMTEFEYDGTTMKVFKVDGTTELMTFTLDNDTSPTSLTRTT